MKKVDFKEVITPLAEVLEVFSFNHFEVEITKGKEEKIFGKIRIIPELEDLRKNVKINELSKTIEELLKELSFVKDKDNYYMVFIDFNKGRIVIEFKGKFKKMREIYNPLINIILDRHGFQKFEVEVVTNEKEVAINEEMEIRGDLRLMADYAIELKSLKQTIKRLVKDLNLDFYSSEEWIKIDFDDKKIIIPFTYLI